MMDIANRKQRVFSKISVGLVVACVLALPDSALSRNYTRHCSATLIVDPEEPGASQVVFGFAAHVTVPTFAMVNAARRSARTYILECIQDHWRARDASQSPQSCRTIRYPGTETFPDYPFTHLSAQLTEALCAANPDALFLSADVRLVIRGERGCVSDGGSGFDPSEEHLIADDFRFRCRGRIGEGSGFENVERGHRGPRPPPPPGR